MSNQNIQSSRSLLNHRRALRKIGSQFNGERFEHRLVRAMLRRAVIDLASRKHRPSALSFLRGPMHLVDLCGVDPTWVRETLARCGVAL